MSALGGITARLILTAGGGEGEVKFYLDGDTDHPTCRADWRSGCRYLLLNDDVASIELWYQPEPHGPFSPLGGPGDLEII